jgi:peroxiredoxin Q/BCP
MGATTMKLAYLASLTIPLALASACANSSDGRPPAGSSVQAGPAAAATPSPAAPGASPIPTRDPIGGQDAGEATTDDLVGKPAPDFKAVANDGTLVHLAGLRGKRVVVYFYPKDETPGCTKEACSLRDEQKGIEKTGAVILGISADTRESHAAFAAHHKLPFLLLSDPQGVIARAYAVPFEGRHRRQTFVIGTDGNVQKAYRSVDVSVHAQQILSDLQRAE